MDKEILQKLEDEKLENVSGGIGAEAEAYDFDKIARDMVLEDKGRSRRLEKAVGSYRIVVMTNFSYDKDFGTYMGSYSYEVYEGEVRVAFGGEGDFAM